MEIQVRSWGPWHSWTHDIVVLLCAWPCLPFCGDVSVCLCSARHKLALSEQLYFYSEAVFQPKWTFLNSSTALLSKDAVVGRRGLQRHKGFLHSLPQQCWWRRYSTTVSPCPVPLESLPPCHMHYSCDSCLAGVECKQNKPNGGFASMIKWGRRSLVILPKGFVWMCFHP